MRRIAKWAAVVAVCLFPLFLVVAAIIHAAWNHERAGRTISAWASKTLMGKGPTGEALVIGGVDYPLWGALRSVLGGRPVRVDVRDFTIWDVDGKEVLHSSHVNVGVQLGRLVRAQIAGHIPGNGGDLQLHLVDAIVDDVRIHIAEDSEHKVNLVHAFKRRKDAKPPKPGSGMVIEVAGSQVHEGKMVMALPGWRAEIDHFSVREKHLRYSSFVEEQGEHAPAFTYRAEDLEAPEGSVEAGDQKFPLDHVVVEELFADDPDRTNLHFELGTNCLGAKIRAKGMLTDTYWKGKTGVDLEVTAKHGAKILAELPSKKFLAGDPSGEAHLKGPFSGMKIEGDVRGLEAHLAKLTAHDAAAHARLAKQTLDITHMHAGLAGGHIEGNATFHLSTQAWRVEVWPKDFQALELGRYLPVEWAAVFVGFFARRNDSGELENHSKIAGIDISLFRSKRAEVPERVVLKKGM